ncbi:AAA family ATPase [Gordonia sp. LSe1-13]|uniref:AAA family ATPase n=1 Tax=Gordonia sesuvii TaxID=3116777 RepID=A0ABU7MD09_9ACTN|nr:AAA family ATPase [Gordonia sp. LSe1-13]
MTYDDSGSFDNSGVPAPPPWLQFAEPEPAEAPPPAPPSHRPPDREQAAQPDDGRPGAPVAPGSQVPPVPPGPPNGPFGHGPVPPGRPMPPGPPGPPPGHMPPHMPPGRPPGPPPSTPPGRGPASGETGVPPGPRVDDAGWSEPSGSPGTGPDQAPSGSWGPPPWADSPGPQAPPPEHPQARAPESPPSPYGPPQSPTQHGPTPQGPAPMGPAPMGPGTPYDGYPMGPPGYGDPQSGPALDEVALIRKARRPPSRGWRRAVHTISAGAINPGESSADLEYKRLLERVNRPVRGDYRIAVLSLKGGVGKTTTTVGLGSTFASLRGDRVIAVDANPDLGTLAQRVPQQTRSTVRDLLADTNVYRYSDVRAHTSQSPSRLEVLASERDPAMAEAFSEEEYRGVMRILQRFYNIIITDCGTGLSHSAMGGVLDLANAIILVSSPAMDGARSAGATLDWLAAHGYGHLVSRAVVVLSSSRPGASTIDTDQLGQHFLTRCRAVHKVPFDDHLSEGADVDLDLVSKQTRRAFVELAATIADDFASVGDERDQPLY